MTIGAGNVAQYIYSNWQTPVRALHWVGVDAVRRP